MKATYLIDADSTAPQVELVTLPGEIFEVVNNEIMRLILAREEGEG